MVERRRVDRRIAVLLAVLAVGFLSPFPMLLYIGQVFMGFVYLAAMLAGTVYAVRQITRVNSK